MRQRPYSEQVHRDKPPVRDLAKRTSVNGIWLAAGTLPLWRNIETRRLLRARNGMAAMVRTPVLAEAILLGPLSAEAVRPPNADCSANGSRSR